MARTVFDKAMVAHVWAQRNQEYGKSSHGNFSFRGPCLYSYSTMIARFVEAPNGQTVVLISDRN